MNEIKIGDKILAKWSGARYEIKSIITTNSGDISYCVKSITYAANPDKVLTKADLYSDHYLSLPLHSDELSKKINTSIYKTPEATELGWTN